VKNCKYCDKNFTHSVSYQIYCSAECRDLATKEKIAERYLHSKRQKRRGKTRLCRSCSSPLSIYNDDAICSSCAINPDAVTKAIKQIKDKTNGKE
jgi:hypothetical protein